MAYKLGDVLLDVITNEEFSSEATATSHAVEDNTELSDHVAMQPRTLSITCKVVDPDNSKLNQLMKYQSEARIIDYNNLTQLTHVVIESISAPRSADIKDGYELSISFKQIKTAQKRAIPLTSGVVARATRNKKQMGLHVPKDATKEGNKGGTRK